MEVGETLNQGSYYLFKIWKTWTWLCNCRKEPFWKEKIQERGASWRNKFPGPQEGKRVWVGIRLRAQKLWPWTGGRAGLLGKQERPLTRQVVEVEGETRKKMKLIVSRLTGADWVKSHYNFVTQHYCDGNLCTSKAVQVLASSPHIWQSQILQPKNMDNSWRWY